MSVRRTGRTTPAHRALVALLAFAGAAILHDPGVLAAQGVVRGRVVDASTGDTVAVTTVQLHNEAGDTVQTATTSDGSFELQVRAQGRYRLHAAALGYDDVTSDPFEAGTTSEIVVEVRLGPRPVDLPALHVVSRRSDYAGPLRDYFRNLEWHRRTGSGRVIDRAELERRGSMPARFLFGGEHGIEVRSRPGMRDVLTVRKFGQECVPDIFIDGLIAESADLLALPLSSIEGIEIYRWTLPPQVPTLAAGSECGLIMAWTRREAGRPLTLGRILAAAGIVGVVLLLAVW